MNIEKKSISIAIFNHKDPIVYQYNGFDLAVSQIMILFRRLAIAF